MLEDLKTMSDDAIELLFQQLVEKYSLGCKLQLQLFEDIKKTRDAIDTVTNHLKEKLNNGI